MSGSLSWHDDRTNHWLTAAWAEGFCKALTLVNPEIGATGFSLEANEPQIDAWTDWSDPVWVLFPCDLTEPSGLCVGCSGAVLKQLGDLALGDPDDADGLGPETYRELISQAVSSVAGAMKAGLGEEVRFAAGVAIAEPSTPSLGIEFSFEAEGVRGSVALVPNTALVEELGGGAESDAPTEPPGEPHVGLEPTAEPDAESLGGIARRNLEILMDLEMEVAVSFGQTEMLLDDVLKLSVGSIVELNCQASDPVEVLVNDSVIARGEVVVVDSNYGVRITEVSSRKERIQTIF